MWVIVHKNYHQQCWFYEYRRSSLYVCYVGLLMYIWPVLLYCLLLCSEWTHIVWFIFSAKLIYDDGMHRFAHDCVLETTWIGSDNHVVVTLKSWRVLFITVVLSHCGNIVETESQLISSINLFPLIYRSPSNFHIIPHVTQFFYFW